MNSLHTCESERRALLDLNRLDCMSWPDIARLERYSEIPMTSLYMFAIGKRPLADEHKLKLGIPVQQPVDVCPIHHVVHDYDCRTQTVRKKAKSNETRRHVFGWLESYSSRQLLYMLDNRQLCKKDTAT